MNLVCFAKRVNGRKPIAFAEWVKDFVEGTSVNRTQVMNEPNNKKGIPTARLRGRRQA
jgi:hypothetical protein